MKACGGIGSPALKPSGRKRSSRKTRTQRQLLAPHKIGSRIRRLGRRCHRPSSCAIRRGNRLVHRPLRAARRRGGRAAGGGAGAQPAWHDGSAHLCAPPAPRFCPRHCRAGPAGPHHRRCAHHACSQWLQPRYLPRARGQRRPHHRDERVQHIELPCGFPAADRESPMEVSRREPVRGACSTRPPGTVPWRAQQPPRRCDSWRATGQAALRHRQGVWEDDELQGARHQHLGERAEESSTSRHVDRPLWTMSTRPAQNKMVAALTRAT